MIVVEQIIILYVINFASFSGKESKKIIFRKLVKIGKSTTLLRSSERYFQKDFSSLQRSSHPGLIACVHR